MSTRQQPSPSGRETRALREVAAYDEGRVWEVSNRWHGRVRHVIEGANTEAGERRFRGLLEQRVPGRRVLDVGCGLGRLSGELHAMGARSVYGFDSSQHEIELARADYGHLRGVTFGVHGAEVPIAASFEVIVGRSILHHLDFRSILPALFERNLLPGGRMLFMEPMSHPFTVAFHRLVRAAHTPDEWPLTAADVAWLRERFAARVLPINLLSFPAGILSSFCLPSPDNRLMRLADRADRSLERRARLRARGRQGIILIDRPRARRSSAGATGPTICV